MLSHTAALEAALSDRYRIERELGRGGMATVYLAHDLRHDRPVALKVLRPELAATLGPDRFLHEIRIAAVLQHPHILPVFDSGDAAGQLWYTMPYVEGQTLRERLLHERQLPLDDACRIALHVLSALEYAHSHGVIHRDVKPENILLEGDQAVVADLGIARAMSAVGEDRLTETGLSLGTPAYMSPEQACAEPNIDGRTDVYSLGCVLYEMLAGEPPYTGPTPQAIVARRLTEPPPRLRTIRDVNESLEQAIHRALARSPADRYATAADFARAVIEAEKATSEPVGSRAAVPAVTRTWAKSVAGAFLLTVVLALAWIAYRRSHPAVPPTPTQLAVLPFSVPGAGAFGYLAEGIVDLLSRNLNGAEGLATVEPGRVMSAVQGARDLGVQDAERGRAIARRLGAGQYVLGSVHAAGRHLRLQAQLYQLDSVAPRAVVQAEVEGDSTELFDLVDKLSAQLLVRRGQGQGIRLAQTAAVTTRSLPALKVYLGAERNLRAASFDSAVAGFQAAVSLDTSFALAYYRLATAAMWAGRTALVARATRRAIALDDRLSERDRNLLSAFGDFVRGAPDDAERQYREILGTYPEDLEARFQLANLLYTYNPPRGRPPAEAAEHYNSVLDVDPKFLCPI
ncbi:MAG: protein kinase [Gemmatimonadales bacterium]|nr:protein kinase [Gemmatimonadales bacterium]